MCVLIICLWEEGTSLLHATNSFSMYVCMYVSKVWLMQPSALRPVPCLALVHAETGAIYWMHFYARQNMHLLGRMHDD